MKPHKAFQKMIKVNGHEVAATVQVFCEQSDLTLMDVIGDAENSVELFSKVNRGDLMITDIIVNISALGIEGHDSLSGCYIGSPDDVQMYLNEHNMIEAAEADFRTQAKIQFQSLNRIFGK